jgi:hypothetical protein
VSEAGNRFGFDYEVLPNQTGDDTEPAVLVKLGDAGGDIVLGETAFKNCVRDSSDAETFTDCVMSRKAATAADWARNRGPDSELGRNQEAGTPTTDHSNPDSA